MNKYTFCSQATNIPSVDGIVDFKRLKDEPMLFNADLNFARKNAGPLTKEILCKIEYPDFGPTDKYVINTRVTMCMPGQYPSIPGWHGDNVPRSSQYNQPDPNKIDPSIKQVLCLIASCEDHSCTEFLDQDLEVSYDPDNVWTSVNSYIDAYDDLLGVKKFQVKPGDLVYFRQSDLHRAMPVINPGWRLFFRLANIGKIENEIRNQVQIYLPVGQGW